MVVAPAERAHCVAIWQAGGYFWGYETRREERRLLDSVGLCCSVILHGSVACGKACGRCGCPCVDQENQECVDPMSKESFVLMRYEQGLTCWEDPVSEALQIWNGFRRMTAYYWHIRRASGLFHWVSDNKDLAIPSYLVLSWMRSWQKEVFLSLHKN